MIRHTAILLFITYAMTAEIGIVFGQNYPDRPLRVVTGTAGGSADFSARLIAQGIAETLRQQVVVVNQNIDPAEVAARSQPDGYTVLLSGNLTWIAPLMHDTAWDPARDLSAVTLVTKQPLILVIHPSLPVKTVSELIALAKGKPGALNYSQGSIGGAPYLATELFKYMSRINIVSIPYKGTGPALVALMSGEVQLTIVDPSAGLPHIRSGRMKALAVTSAQPSALLPGLTTIAASGVPGYESANASAMFVPAKTPEAIIRRLNEETVRFVTRPEVKAKYFAMAAEVMGSSPEELSATIQSEMATMGKVIKEAKLRIN